MARAEPMEGTGPVPNDDAVPEAAVEPNERAVGYIVFPGASSDEAVVGESSTPRDQSEAGAVDPCDPVKVYFREGSTELDRAARAKLDRLATCVQDAAGVTVQRSGPVSGFTPAVGRVGAEAPATDQRRTAAVRGYLRDTASPPATASHTAL